MKRHQALIPLSHDHQNALARALRLRRARDLPSNERRDELDSFLAFADQRLEPHFLEEEAMLASITAAHALPELAAAHRTMLDEHAELRMRIQRLRGAGGDPDPALLHDTGTKLTSHIRFEERELFELLQRHLGDELANAITDPHADAGH